jgi:HPt (histidine-containing phosphotransfer) domain-containing protein
VQLDAERLQDLQVFNEAELREIGLRAIRAISEQLLELDRELAREDLRAAGEAAHRARNEALLVGARELAAALGVVEESARAGRGSVASEAAATAQEVWPSTRDAIRRATHSDTG